MKKWRVVLYVEDKRKWADYLTEAQMKFIFEDFSTDNFSLHLVDICELPE